MTCPHGNSGINQLIFSKLKVGMYDGLKWPEHRESVDASMADELPNIHSQSAVSSLFTRIAISEAVFIMVSI